MNPTTNDIEPASSPKDDNDSLPSSGGEYGWFYDVENPSETAVVEYHLIREYKTYLVKNKTVSVSDYFPEKTDSRKEIVEMDLEPVPLPCSHIIEIREPPNAEIELHSLRRNAGRPRSRPLPPLDPAGTDLEKTLWIQLHIVCTTLLGICCYCICCA